MLTRMLSLILFLLGAFSCALLIYLWWQDESPRRLLGELAKLVASSLEWG